MHYYQFNIGDYAKSTKHLTLIEDIAYRRLLDIYYDTEKPLMLNIKQLSRIAGMSEYQEEINNILNDFFIKSENGYTQKKADEEISNYHSKADVARANGRKGGRPKESQSKPKKTQLVNSANPAETGSEANYKPLTINQESLTNNQLKEKETPVKLDYSVLQMTDLQIKDVIRIRRKNKGTALTQRIINSLADEFKKGWGLGLNVDDMITEWEVRGWKSFKAEWMKSNNQPQQSNSHVQVSTKRFF